MNSPSKIEIFSKKTLKTKGIHSLEKLNFNITWVKPPFIFSSVQKLNGFTHLNPNVFLGNLSSDSLSFHSFLNKMCKTIPIADFKGLI